MGGGTKIESAPTQPSTAEAVKAWAETKPQVYETQLKYAPLEAAQQVQLAQQFAQPLAAAYKTAQETLYPETSALQEQMSGQAATGIESGLSPAEEAQYRSDIGANLGTNAGSPIGAEYTSRNLMLARQGRQDYYRNLGLSLAGRQPLAQPSTPATTNYLGSYTPATALGYQSNSIQNFQTRSPDYLGATGSTFGGIGSMYTGFGWGQ